MHPSRGDGWYVRVVFIAWEGVGLPTQCVLSDLILFSHRPPFLRRSLVAARGLDVDDIRIVVNFDFPKEMESYVHRVGRTGRAGKKGLAVSFFVPEKNGRLARELIEILNRSRQVVPPQLQALASFSGGGGGGRSGRGGGRRY